MNGGFKTTSEHKPLDAVEGMIMSEHVTEKEMDCDHKCTYDSDRKHLEVIENPDGTKTFKTGYRKCVDECLEKPGAA